MHDGVGGVYGGAAGRDGLLDVLRRGAEQHLLPLHGHLQVHLARMDPSVAPDQTSIKQEQSLSRLGGHKDLGGRSVDIQRERGRLVADRLPRNLLRKLRLRRRLPLDRLDISTRQAEVLDQMVHARLVEADLECLALRRQDHALL
eukprot:scaffold1798_cov248-Pinguiococcus_pyrenoidosus.AAC.3